MQTSAGVPEPEGALTVIFQRVQRQFDARIHFTISRGRFCCRRVRCVGRHVEAEKLRGSVRRRAIDRASDACDYNHEKGCFVCGDGRLHQRRVAVLTFGSRRSCGQPRNRPAWQILTGAGEGFRPERAAGSRPDAPADLRQPRRLQCGARAGARLAWARRRTLPGETRAYVRIITGRSAEEWVGDQRKDLEILRDRGAPRRFAYMSRVSQAADIYGDILGGACRHGAALPQQSSLSPVVGWLPVVRPLLIRCLSIAYLIVCRCQSVTVGGVIEGKGACSGNQWPFSRS